MDPGTIAAFLAVDLLLVFTPGADWAYAIAAGARGRPVSAVAGLVSGYAVHTLLVVAGLAALVARTPGLLAALTLVGAGYLVWLGATSLLRPGEPAPVDAPGPESAWGAALRGAGISGLNPKGLLLFLALLPQFVSPGPAAAVAVQIGLLGAVHMLSCGVVYLAVAVAGRAVLAQRPRAARAVARVSGALMIGIAAALLAEHVPW